MRHLKDPPSTSNVFPDGVTQRIFSCNSFLDASRLLGMKWEVQDTFIDDEGNLGFFLLPLMGSSIQYTYFGMMGCKPFHYSLNEVFRTCRHLWRAKKTKLTERCARVDFLPTDSY